MHFKSINFINKGNSIERISPIVESNSFYKTIQILLVKVLAKNFIEDIQI